MNWVDLVIIFLLIFFAVEGLGRTLIGEAIDFVSFLLAFFLALRFYNLAADFYQSTFQIPHSLSAVFGFISVWFLVEACLFLIIHFSLKKIKIPDFKELRINYLAVIPAFSRGLIFISILLILAGTFPIQPKIKDAIDKSTIGSAILSYTQRLEQPLKNVFGGLSNDTLTFLTIKPKSNESVNLGFKLNEFKVDSGKEVEMIGLVNKEREANGFKRLNFDEKLRIVARAHSEDMFRRGYFSHYSPEGKSVADRGEENGVKYLVIGENLAYAPSLGLAHDGLMNSPGHKANILSPEYNKIGIGILDGGVYGLMITQVFSN